MIQNDQEIIYKIKQAIDRGQRFLVVAHRGPDGDTLGCLSAMAQYFNFLKKDFKLFCLDPAPEKYGFLPLIHLVKNDFKVFEAEYDAVIVFDASDLKYAGIDSAVNKSRHRLLINIDHHKTNLNYGDLNLVKSDFSSAAEVLYYFFREAKVSLTKDIATALLNGIISDTGAFSNAGTTFSSLKVASHLLNLGAGHGQINEKFLRDKSVAMLKLWGRAFERLQFNHGYGLAFTVIVKQDFIDLNLDEESGSGLSNFFNELAGVKAVMVLTENSAGFIKGSFRTTRNDVDVSKLAFRLGGGGHQKAAGFSIKGELVYNGSRWIVRT